VAGWQGAVYTSIVKTTTTLLTCVYVDGMSAGFNNFRLLKAGEVGCYQPWQGAVWAAFVMVVLPFPGVLFWWMQRQRHQQQGELNSESAGVESGAKVIMLQLTSNFMPNRWYWAPIILAQRLVFAMVYSFVGVQGPMAQATLFTLFATLFAVVEAAYRPYRAFTDRAASLIQMVLLVCLAQFSSWSAALHFAAAEVQKGSAASKATGTFQTLQIAVFWMPTTILAVLLLYRLWRLRQKGIGRSLKLQLRPSTMDGQLVANTGDGREMSPRPVDLDTASGHGSLKTLEDTGDAGRVLVPEPTCPTVVGRLKDGNEDASSSQHKEEGHGRTDQDVMQA
jgi:hypothetical protein